ncbi:hypothetical protein [Litchfieldia salsa]|uniref:Uncharacterized protein n=1 Tax=Litchfieldia salsa TaxID=930152 RepID=A0A1H0Q9Y1_9BACI|nr:hypothetical protein [Litchfieldia salsa]SDP13516.1 hypothetical protein SAMN05216565_101646 [Litchfieldia salsa]
MNTKKEEVRKQIQLFFKLLEKHKDIPQSIPYFKSYLRQLIMKNRGSDTMIPTIEMMTVLKNEKPLVFQLLKQQSKGDYNLEFLTGLSMNYEDAKGKLELFLNQE